MVNRTPAYIRTFLYGAILASLCPVADAYAASIPDCAGAVEIARAHVTRVEKNGVLVLSDGRAVTLEGIRLPDEEGQRQQALAALRAMTEGSITFTATAPKEDRYDRVRAQGFNDKDWLQAALLEKGLARVSISPDRSECAPDLYDAEAHARDQRAGLWASSTNAPRQAEQMRKAPAAREGNFQVVEGWVTNVAEAGGRTFIDFGSNGRQNFSAVIQPEDRRAFRGFDLESLEAHRIRIRGIVQDYRGRPEIALSNPAQIEVLN
jgi:endonuclease YncB( thermonuclease family)